MSDEDKLTVKLPFYDANVSSKPITISYTLEEAKRDPWLFLIYKTIKEDLKVGDFIDLKEMTDEIIYARPK